MENVLKGLPDKIRDQLCIIHKCTSNVHIFESLSNCEIVEKIGRAPRLLHDLTIWKWFKNVYIWSAFVYDAQLISDFVR
jgi:hypothetical protein